jgi:hypothetical protein
VDTESKYGKFNNNGVKAMNIETYEKQLETRNYNVGAALSKLAPGTSWAVEGNTYAGIIWNSDESLKPSEEAVEAEMARLKTAWDSAEYQRLRAKEYPDIKEYLDGVVKGDQVQIQAYIDAGLAVKTKYPK